MVKYCETCECFIRVCFNTITELFVYTKLTVVLECFAFIKCYGVYDILLLPFVLWLDSANVLGMLYQLSHSYSKQEPHVQCRYLTQYCTARSILYR